MAKAKADFEVMYKRLNGKAEDQPRAWRIGGEGYEDVGCYVIKHADVDIVGISTKSFGF